jgi:hypothetical protein
MSARKYLLDEHVSPRLQKALQRHSPDMVVWRIGDPGAPPLHSPDPDFILNPNLDLGQTIDELILISVASESDEYADQLNYLPLSW